jgi:hypothetical protein
VTAPSLQPAPAEARFRSLIERIASWTDAEVACVSPGQVRHIAQLVLDGANPTYPPFANSIRKHEEAEVVRLREHIAEQIIHVGNRIQDGRDLGETVWGLALEDVVRENRAVLALEPRVPSGGEAHNQALFNALLASSEHVADPTRTQPPAAQGAGDLPDVLPGHWATPAGRDMALAALSDPHMAYNRGRQPDMQLANDVFLSPGIGNLTAAKERIRWLSAQSALATMPRTSQQNRYLVWSNEHRAWWKPAHHGYTRRVEDAGRYDRAEAMSIASRRGGGWPIEENPFEIAILEADAVEQAAASQAARAERGDA